MLLLFVVAFAACVVFPAADFGAGAQAAAGRPHWQLLGDFVRFPVRLFWVGLLAMAALASVAGTLLEQRVGGAARWVVALLVMEAFLQHHLPLRQQRQLAVAPAVYGQAQGPVLDLFPMVGRMPMEQELRFNASACLAQARHHHVSAEHCTSTDPSAGPRYRISRLLETLLLAGRGQRAREALQEMGFEHLAWHADLYQAQDRERFELALSALGQPRLSVDGGELLYWYSFAGAEAVDPAGAYQRLMEPGALDVRGPQGAGPQGPELNPGGPGSGPPMPAAPSSDHERVEGGVPKLLVPFSLGPHVRYRVAQATELGLGAYVLLLLALGSWRWRARRLSATDRRQS